MYLKLSSGKYRSFCFGLDVSQITAQYDKVCTLLSITLQWCYNERTVISNQQPHDCLLNRLFGRISKKPSKLRVTGLCAGNSPVIGEFPAQKASNAENVSIWWRHHHMTRMICCFITKYSIKWIPHIPLNPIYYAVYHRGLQCSWRKRIVLECTRRPHGYSSKIDVQYALIWFQIASLGPFTNT